MIHSHRRGGFSLTEVLITLGILAIGLLALLTLFPYGAIQMSQSVKDDRTAYCARAAHAQFKLIWQDVWLRPDGSLRTWPEVKQLYPELGGLDDPDDGGPLPTLPPPFESYPMLIDPYGVYHTNFISPNPGQSNWVAGGPPFNETRIPRRWITGDASLGAKNFFPSPQDVIRRCTFLDTITFGEGGSAENAGEVQRYDAQYRRSPYTWSWLIQRPPGAEPDEVNLVVVTHVARTLDTPTMDFAYPANFYSGDTLVELQMPDAVTPPPIAKNGWIMDASQAAVGGRLQQRAQFYRVLNMQQQDGNPTMWNIELQAPAIYGANMSAGGRAYFLGVIASSPNEIIGQTISEVFERGTVTPFSRPLATGEF